MSVWRYTAIQLEGDAGRPRRGSMSGESAAEVRASLRRAGLQVVSLREERARARQTGVAGDSPESLLLRWRRSRRGHDRAELYDALATLLDSGVPLLDALDTLLGARLLRRGPIRRMLVDVREQVRSGAPVAEAVRAHPDWFDATEAAMLEAAQQGGMLAQVLRDLAERQERSEALGHRLASVLTYPIIVAVVGVGVAVFLSVRILPDLVKILVESRIEVPLLTRVVMAVGQGLASWWPLVLGAAVLLVVVAMTAGRLARWLGPERLAPLERLVPPVLRRLALASVSIRLAELVRTGVPMTEALRVIAPTLRGPVAGLGRALRRGAERLEQGQELSEALDDPRWFDSEFRRLLEVGQVGGDLDVLLNRLGTRYERSGRRLIDRLASLLEPTVIVLLAVLVGIVVMSAVLPLVKLQQVV